MRYYYKNALQTAARINYFELVEILFNADTNINFIDKKYETTMKTIVIKKHFQLLKLFVKQGVNINLKIDNINLLILQLII